MEESTRLKQSNNMLRTNQKGFSLVSVMVAVGLLGGVSLAVMQLSQNANQVNNMSQIKTDEIELNQSLRMVLNDPAHCQAGILGETFEKKLVDNDGIIITSGSDFQDDDEGLDIELWYGKDGGTIKTHKKFNGFDNPSISPDPEKSKFGKLKIMSIKLVMNNGMGSCADNYCDGLDSDTGQVVVIYEKKINKNTMRTHKKIIDVNVGFATITGVSTILSCTGIPLSAGLVKDSQSVSGNMINGLNPASKYLVNIYGIAPNKGNGMATLGGLTVTDCTGVGLAQTPSQSINWPDGQPTQSGSLLITAPASGCIRTYVDTTVSALYTSAIEI
jgi:type II secretory pathway pseudopilin PulG